MNIIQRRNIQNPMNIAENIVRFHRKTYFNQSWLRSQTSSGSRTIKAQEWRQHRVSVHKQLIISLLLIFAEAFNVRSHRLLPATDGCEHFLFVRLSQWQTRTMICCYLSIVEQQEHQGNDMAYFRKKWRFSNHDFEVLPIHMRTHWATRENLVH